MMRHEPPADRSGGVDRALQRKRTVQLEVRIDIEADIGENEATCMGETEQKALL